MTKTFSVNIGGQSMQIDGPDEGTQEQAQEQATRHWQQKQAADVDKDFTGETGRQGITNPLTGKPTGILGGDFGANIGRKVANFAQGGAEVAGGPAQLAGATPGPRYQQAENEPTTTGDNIARAAGAATTLAPLGGGAGAVIPRVVGGVEGASAPAASPTQRVVNTGIGAFTGGFGRAGGGSSALDRLAGTAAGMMMGHGMGGAESLFSTYLGGKIGGQVGHEAHEAVAAFLRKFPPSVVARAVASLGGSMSKSLADQYDYLERDRGQNPNR
jgi:hypothetical protein